MQELRACIDAFGLNLDLYFWRTATGSEVDFVLYGDDGFHAIEVKRKRRIGGHDLRGLRTFLSDYPEATASVFYGGDRMEYRDGITLFPIVKAITSLPKSSAVNFPLPALLDVPRKTG